MGSTKKIEFDAAIRGFHYYKKYWKPKVGEILVCSHEDDNPFDIFAIQTCDENGATVGHLPRELSRVSKFLLDRGAVISAKLSSTRYRRSPLVQGGMEIPCKVFVEMRPTVKNNEILDRYLTLVETLYTEPETPVILGSIIFDDLEAQSSSSVKQRKYQGKSNVEKSFKRKTRNADIRDLFQKQHKRQEAVEKVQNEEVSGTITLD